MDELFKIRNQLVHPKPGLGPGYGGDPGADFNPVQAARFLTVVSGLSHVLVGWAYGEDVTDPLAFVIWFGRMGINEYADAAAKSLPDVDSDTGRKLFRLALDAMPQAGPETPDA